MTSGLAREKYIFWRQTQCRGLVKYISSSLHATVGTRPNQLIRYIITVNTLYISQLIHYIITLRIQALLLVESHDLLEDGRTELRHTKPYPMAFPYLYRSCTRDILPV